MVLNQRFSSPWSASFEVVPKAKDFLSLTSNSRRCLGKLKSHSDRAGCAVRTNIWWMVDFDPATFRRTSFGYNFTNAAKQRMNSARGRKRLSLSNSSLILFATANFMVRFSTIFRSLASVQLVTQDSKSKYEQKK